MIKNSAFLFLALLVCKCVSAQTFSTPPGSGSFSDPYKLSSLEHLYWMAISTNEWSNTFSNTYFVQTVNIDAAATANWFSGQGWRPVGDSAGTKFSGNYDGGGFKISNLYINRPDRSCVGFFGYAENAKIVNLGIELCNITGKHAVGGLVGYSNSFIINCVVSGNVSGNTFVGGFAGYNTDSLINSGSHCIVAGNSATGGFAGYNGRLIASCYSSFTVEAASRAGGLVGENRATIIDSYSRSAVTRTAGSTLQNIGSFVGLYGAGTIQRCYATGTVEYEAAAPPTNKGFAGAQNAYNTLNNYFDSETSMQATGAGAQARTTAEMKIGSTFALNTWQFASMSYAPIWNIGNGRNDGYPYHVWQYSSDPATILNITPTIAASTLSIGTDNLCTARSSITRLGSPMAYEHGFCWALEPEPDLNSSVLFLGTPAGTGNFSSILPGLEAGKTYFVRSFMVSATDTVFGTQASIFKYAHPQGAGTEASPYLISNYPELFWIRFQVNVQRQKFLNTYFLQTADIDFEPYDSNWTGIGNLSTTFQGHYDGNGKIISNMVIDRTSVDYQGLFGNKEYGSLKNITIKNASIKAKNRVGILVGYGVDLTIANCHVEGAIEGNTSIGGMIGGSLRVSISQSSAHASVYGESSVGGFIGLSGSFNNIQESFSAGNVSAMDNAGGFVGNKTSGYTITKPEIVNCYTLSDVEGRNTGAAKIGSFAGISDFMAIYRCFAAGKLTGGSIGGGFFADMINTAAESEFEHASIPDNTMGRIWDAEAAGSDLKDCNTGYGHSTAELKHLQTYTDKGWKFSGIDAPAIWNIGSGRNGGYPYLIWQYPADAPLTDDIQASISIIGHKIDGALHSIQTRLLQKGKPLHTEYGLCYNTTGNPGLADHTSSVAIGLAADTMLLPLEGLQAGQIYYVRAYIKSPLGVSYSNEIKMFAFEPLAGSGTQSDPYLLSTIDDLRWFSYSSNYGHYNFAGKYLRLTNDIDASDTRNWNGGKGWEPVYLHIASFDGGYHAIDGLYINRPDEEEVGFFRMIYGQVTVLDVSVKNLGLTNVDITGKTGGGLVAYLTWTSIVSCYTTGVLNFNGSTCSGGLVGWMTYASVNYCYSSADVYAASCAGGLVGRCWNDGANASPANNGVLNSYATGNVTRTSGSSEAFAGLVARVETTKLLYSYSTGSVFYAGEDNPTDKALIAFASTPATIINWNAWDKDASNQTADAVASTIGASGTEMRNKAFHESQGRHFEIVTDTIFWQIDTAKNDGYPYFNWQKFKETPDVSTVSVTDITASGATVNATISSSGLTEITAHGICWNTSGNPNINGECVHVGATQTGDFSASLSLSDNCATYYARAYASNSEGTAYGRQITFKLKDETTPILIWENGNQEIEANLPDGYAAVPDFTQMLFAEDNCPGNTVEISQSPEAGTLLSGNENLIIIAATDEAGNKSEISFNLSVTYQEYVSQNIELEQGWNLISVNVHVADSTISSLFAGLDVLEIKDMNSFWRTGQAGALNSLQTITTGKGYLVKMNAAGILVISGTQCRGVLQYAPTGWQLIGYPCAGESSFAPIPFSNYFNATNAEIIKNFDGFWQPSGTTNSVHNFEPGKGYFLKK
jgi:hypothetical protein